MTDHLPARPESTRGATGTGNPQQQARYCGMNWDIRHLRGPALTILRDAPAERVCLAARTGIRPSCVPRAWPAVEMNRAGRAGRITA